MALLTFEFVRSYVPCAVAGIVIFVLYTMGQPCSRVYDLHKLHTLSDSNGTDHHYNRSHPFIFIAGMPGAGPTLVRSILDAHSDIRCSSEITPVASLIGARGKWMSEKESVRLEEAGVSKKVLDQATSSFILDLVLYQGQPVRRLCYKDYSTLESASYFGEFFPNAKFLFVVRDGRANVHHIISNNIQIPDMDTSSYERSLLHWNKQMKLLNAECSTLGSLRCLKVYYEKLVLRPEETRREIFEFLGVDRDGVNKADGVLLSDGQILNPVNHTTLTKWVSHIPKDIMPQIPYIAPMLGIFGYDPKAKTPKYE